MSLRSYVDWHWWFRGRREIFEKLVDESISNKNKRILVPGYQIGFEPQFLRKFNEVIYFGPDNVSKEMNRSLQGNFIKGQLPAIPLRQNSVDYICCFDVLEHLSDDQYGLSEMSRVLCSGGELFLSVPAFSFLWSKQDERIGHQRRYTRRSLENDLIQHGFSIKFSSYINTFLFLPGILVKFWKSLNLLSSPKQSYPMLNMNSPGLLNKVLSKIFSFESKILPEYPLPFGLSIFLRANLK